MARAKLQDLPVEVLLLLPEHVSDRDGDRDRDQDSDDDDDDSRDDDNEGDDSMDDDNEDDDNEDDDNEDDDNEDDDNEDDDGDVDSYNGSISSRQYLIGCLARVNRRFHSIFNPILYRTAVRTQNNAITTLAARDGRLETLKKAVQYGADLNVVTWVPLPQWASAGERGRLIQEYPDCPKDTSYGFCWATPLHMAASEGHCHVAKYLISIGVDVDVPGKLICDCISIAEQGARFPEPEHFQWNEMVILSGVWTPLHYAICQRKGPVARLLVAHGASLEDTRYPVRDEIPRENGIASLFGLDLADPEKAASIHRCLHTLIYSIGTSIKVPDWPDGEFLDIDAEWAPFEMMIPAAHTAVAVNDLPMIYYLVVDCGVDINAMDGAGDTLLHYSLTTQNSQTVRYVLSLGADPNFFLRFSTCVPFENAGEFAVVRNWFHGKKETPRFLDEALQALMDYGVSCWTLPAPPGYDRNPCVWDSHFKSFMVNKCCIWLDGANLEPPHAGWFRRFLKIAIAEYDPADGCRDLREEVMDLFWIIMIRSDFDDAIDMVDTLISLAGPIDFTAAIGEGWSRSREEDESASIGAVCFRKLESCSQTPRRMNSELLNLTLAKVEWLMKQGVTTTPEMWQFSAALVREQCRREFQV
ncbi:hypothetical protein N0V92_005892 [Colletotrichum tropicale]|nr:hypothetical protein N0V92_005892 [Colletotrichum tropicale]